MADLYRVGKRKALKPRREPHWMELSRGKRLGYRRMSSSSPGSWIARVYVGDERYESKALSDFADLPEEQRFEAAKKAAEEFFTHIGMGGTTQKVTVKQACQAYVDKLRQEKGDAAAEDTAGRFRRLVNDDPIAHVELSKLAARQFAEWKKRTLAKGGSRSYFNRNATALRAALNLAKDRREVVSDVAWKKELKPLDGAESRRTLYLDHAKRKELVDNASKELKPLVTALALLPLRPGELVNARVSDMDTKHATLRIVGATRKKVERTIPLPADALTHFKACAKEKLPQAWLVSRADGRQWDRFTWRDEIKLAAAAAKLPKATCLYTLRHSTITDLVTGGLDIFTVAKISGTSVAMIEKYYGHLQREHARQALTMLSLK